MSKTRITKVQFKEHVQMGLAAIPEKDVQPGKKAHDKVHVVCSFDGKTVRIDYEGKKYFTLVPLENIASILMEEVDEPNTSQTRR
jgi:endonuclease YncB( thermonuclease family)